MSVREGSVPTLRLVPDPLRGLIAGVAGGVVGCLAMAVFQGAWSRALGPPTRPAEDDVAGDAAPSFSDRPSTVRGAGALARFVTGRELPAKHERAAGRAFHFAFGGALGGAYGVLMEYVPLASAGSGSISAPCRRSSPMN